MTNELDLNAIEALNIAYADDFARNRSWEHAEMHDPLQDLDLFFKHINGTRMLDVGCGWARYVEFFLEHQLQYIGVDSSPQMLQAAKETHTELRFEHMSFRSLAFGDESFDGLWCCCVFSGIPKRYMPEILAELRRVLVTGGIAMIIMPLGYESGEEMICDDEEKPLLWSADYEHEELCGLLTQSGFSIVESNQRYYNGAQSVLVRK